MMRKLYSPIKENKDDLENFDTSQHTGKIDTPCFHSLKTIQLLYQTIFRQTRDLKVISSVQVT